MPMNQGGHSPPGRRRDVCLWPIAADIAVEPNVGFRGTADIVRSGHQAHR